MYIKLQHSHIFLKELFKLLFGKHKMKIIKHIKTILLLLITFVLVAQPAHAKTEVIVPTYQKLKQSRIGIWIDLYGLRKTQYISGYKDVMWY